MKKILFIIFGAVVLVGVLFLILHSRSGEKNKAEEDKIRIMVSVLPQVDFVKRVGGDKVSVDAMIPPGFSPATYDPSPEQLIKLQKADIYFRIGKIAFEESQIDKLADINKRMLIIDTSKGVDFRRIENHSHDEDDEHGDGTDVREDEADENEDEIADDPHIWLSPRLVKIQVKNIYEALAELDFENKDYYFNNYQEMISDLDELDSKLSLAFVPIKDSEILVYHPAFGYLADAYGFKQEAIEINGKEPSPEHLKNIIDRALNDQVKVIFVQAQFSTKSAEAIAKEIGGSVIQIDPLAENYFINLETMAEAIVKNFQ